MNPLQQIADNLSAAGLDHPAVDDAVIKLTNWTGGGASFRALAERAVPFLRDEANKYEDDGSNEPLELAREIESLLASAPSDESALPSADLAFDGGAEAAHPSRGVVGEAEPGAVASLVAAANATLAANPHDDTMWSLEAAVAPFNASKPAECASGCPPQQVCDYCQVAAKHKLQAALPAVPDEMLRAFSDAAVDAAMTGTGIIKLTGKEGGIAAECVPPESVTFAATPVHDQPEGTASSSEDEQDESCSGCFRHSCNGECMHGD